MIDALEWNIPILPKVLPPVPNFGRWTWYSDFGRGMHNRSKLSAQLSITRIFRIDLIRKCSSNEALAMGEINAQGQFIDNLIVSQSVCNSICRGDYCTW